MSYRDKLAFPFKRYQIQPVWRADRPQKGRYQEFFQCDADVIGSDSLYNEVELIQIIDRVYKKLKVENISIKLNNRKILQGIAEVVNAEDKFIDLTVAIDKLDKIGVDKVIEELLSRGLTQESVDQLKKYLEFVGNNTQTLEFLENNISSSEIGKKGLEEMKFIVNALDENNVANLKVDIMLARGLSYYTGTILEVQPLGTEMKGSINGGGRYDDLTGNFGMPGVSGVGFSFGLDRIYDVMNELDLFKNIDLNTTKILFIAFDEESQNFVFNALNKVREMGIASEMYPVPVSQSKMKKQMKYADDKKIPFVAIVGSNEMENQQFTLKNMESGEQQLVDLEALIAACKS